MVTENNRLVYSSDYPIQEIESIQSEVGIGYGRLNSTSSLIIKLKNTHTKRVVYKVVIYFSRVPVTEIRYPSLRQTGGGAGAGHRGQDQREWLMSPN